MQWVYGAEFSATVWEPGRKAQSVVSALPGVSRQAAGCSGCTAGPETCLELGTSVEERQRVNQDKQERVLSRTETEKLAGGTRRILSNTFFFQADQENFPKTLKCWTWHSFQGNNRLQLHISGLPESPCPRTCCCRWHFINDCDDENIWTLIRIKIMWKQNSCFPGDRKLFSKWEGHNTTDKKSLEIRTHHVRLTSAEKARWQQATHTLVS